MIHETEGQEGGHTSKKSQDLSLATFMLCVFNALVVCPISYTPYRKGSSASSVSRDVLFHAQILPHVPHLTHKCTYTSHIHALPGLCIMGQTAQIDSFFVLIQNPGDMSGIAPHLVGILPVCPVTTKCSRSRNMAGLDSLLCPHQRPCRSGHCAGCRCLLYNPIKGVLKTT